MLYTFLVEYYVWLSVALLCVTFFARKTKPALRSTFLYSYALIASLGFLLDLQWVSGVLFGLLLVEIGRPYRTFINEKVKSKYQDR
ncbi:hypothetical protein [Marinomonas sp. 2405UD68-3]|uniref:hypothetical protein n=1 Tax=Marinomonas sp. 2405UD68-3 TaxID=3391835 RepID=UPI0039C98E44